MIQSQNYAKMWTLEWEAIYAKLKRILWQKINSGSNFVLYVKCYILDRRYMIQMSVLWTDLLKAEMKKKWAFKHQTALGLFCLDLEMLKSLSEAELFSFSVPLCGEYFCIAEYFRCKESKFVWCKLANLWRLLKLKLLAYLLLWKYLLQWKCDTWIFGALQMW